MQGGGERHRAAPLVRRHREAGEGEGPARGLVDGLVPKDPDVEYGHLTHAKYVAKLAKLLEPYDLAPYRGRIEEAFAATKDRKVREVLGGLLGGRRTTAAPERRKAPFDPAKGYRMDSYAAGLVAAADAAAKKKRTKLPAPIEAVRLGGIDGNLRLETLVLEGMGEPLERAGHPADPDPRARRRPRGRRRAAAVREAARARRGGRPVLG